jgi:hypothetical protein
MTKKRSAKYVAAQQSATVVCVCVCVCTSDAQCTHQPTHLPTTPLAHPPHSPTHPPTHICWSPFGSLSSLDTRAHTQVVVVVGVDGGWEDDCSKARQDAKCVVPTMGQLFPTTRDNHTRIATQLVLPLRVQSSQTVMHVNSVVEYVLARDGLDIPPRFVTRGFLRCNGLASVCVCACVCVCVCVCVWCDRQLASTLVAEPRARFAEHCNAHKMWLHAISTSHPHVMVQLNGQRPPAHPTHARHPHAPPPPVVSTIKQHRNMTGVGIATPAV